jgi:uncharacterized protein (TIGR02302 family)
MNQDKPQKTNTLTKLASLLFRARFTLAFELLWPMLARIGFIGLLYVSLAWSGIFNISPSWLKITIILVLTIPLLIAIIKLCEFRFPNQKAAFERLDRDSGLPHRPLATALDAQALGAQDSTSSALWGLHQQRAEKLLSKLSLKLPQSALSGIDPKALRIGAIIAAFASFFVAGSDWKLRLMSGFDWSDTTNATTQVRLDAWVDPPAYTNRAPIFISQPNLDKKSLDKDLRILVPIGSVLFMRASPSDNVSFAISGSLKQQDDAKKDQSNKSVKQPTLERRYDVKGDGSVIVKNGSQMIASFTLAAIPDAPPSVEFLSAIRKPKSEGADEVNSDVLVLRYRLKDDYGVASGDAFAEVLPDPKGRTTRLIVPLPKMPLSTPNGNGNALEAETTIDLSEHPLAGAKLRMFLKVKDDLGQEASSNALDITIPQKPFANPVSKALTEQRRNLVVYPDDKVRPSIALVGLLTEPEAFRTSTTLYTALRMAQVRLKNSRTDAHIIDLADWLWQIALDEENGSLTAAEKALRAAQESLREAIERGAPPEEIKRLAENLRKAMDRYMREFADNKRKPSGSKDPNAKMLSENDLAKILEKIEELTKQGKTADAQRLLEKLNEMLKNMQTAEGSGAGGKQQNKTDLQKKADELEEMIRDERALRDRTFREGQEFQRSDRGEQSGEEEGKGQDNKGQKGQGKNGDEKGGNSLQNRQKRLSDALEKLQKGLNGQGEGGQELSDALDAMREAERSLGEGKNGKAAEKQGKALEALRRGAQGLQQKLSELGEGDRDRTGGKLGGDKTLTDPLGRPLMDGKLQNDSGDNNAKLRADGKGGGTIEERSRAVLEELRRRLGELARPQTELDYIERLLRKN